MPTPTPRRGEPIVWLPHWHSPAPRCSEQWVCRTECRAKREFVAVEVETIACGGASPCRVNHGSEHRVTCRNRGGVTVDLELTAGAGDGLCFGPDQSTNWSGQVTAPARRELQHSTASETTHALIPTSATTPKAEITFSFKILDPGVLNQPGSVALTVRL